MYQSSHQHTIEAQAKLDGVADPPDVSDKSTVLLFHLCSNFLNGCLMSRRSDGRGRQVDYKISSRGRAVIFKKPDQNNVTVWSQPGFPVMVSEGRELNEWLSLTSRYGTFLTKSFHI